MRIAHRAVTKLPRLLRLIVGASAGWLFLSHDFYLSPHFARQGEAGRRSGTPEAQPEPFLIHHEEIAEKRKFQLGLRSARPYRSEFTGIYQLLTELPPTLVRFLPSETYDHVWPPAGKPSIKSQFRRMEPGAIRPWA